MKCEFCSILNREPDNNTLGFDRFLYEIKEIDSSYFLMADYSPIYPGHYLLISKNCKDRMLDSSESVLKEYFLVLGHALKKLNRSGEFIIYEHGGIKCKNNGCQDHAHTHIVEIKDRATIEYVTNELNTFGFISYDLNLNQPPSDEYLHILTESDFKNGSYGIVYQYDHKIPSALVRSIINLLDDYSGLVINNRSSKEQEYFNLTENELADI